MNLERAIEVLTQDLTCDFVGSNDALVAALQLGIEALERLIALRRLAPPFKTAEEVLPSETLE